jgi:hypothetical protein
MKGNKASSALKEERGWLILRSGRKCGWLLSAAYALWFYTTSAAVDKQQAIPVIMIKIKKQLQINCFFSKIFSKKVMYFSWHATAINCSHDSRMAKNDRRVSHFTEA